MKVFVNKPLILADKGTVVPEDLVWRYVIFGMRNHIKRWFGILKARTKCFYNNLPKQLNHPKYKTSIDLHS